MIRSTWACVSVGTAARWRSTECIRLVGLLICTGEKPDVRRIWHTSCAVQKFEPALATMHAGRLGACPPQPFSAC